MKLLVQRVLKASVKVKGKTVGKVGRGLLVLVGVGKGDTKEGVKKLTKKLLNIRIMSDLAGKMNLSIKDTHAEVLVVSQFTLYADVNGGNRPSFINAEVPELAKEIYEYLVDELRKAGIIIKTGIFGEDMKISAVLDGPVTIAMNTNEHQ